LEERSSNEGDLVAGLTQFEGKELQPIAWVRLNLSNDEFIDLRLREYWSTKEVEGKPAFYQMVSHKFDESKHVHSWYLFVKGQRVYMEFVNRDVKKGGWIDIDVHITMNFGDVDDTDT
jgi:hypothetical protein